MKELKVFKFVPDVPYSGGCAIIVAYTALEAFGLLCKDCPAYADEVDQKPTIIEDLIPSKDVKEPKVITCNIYIE